MASDQTKRSVLFAATTASFLTPFMGTGVNVALPAIQAEFRLDAIFLSWMATSYLLSTAVFIVPFGRIADIHGRKKIFLLGITVFTLSCVLASCVPNAVLLLVSRFIQGLGSAMIFATGIAILTSVFPPHERGRAIGITIAAIYIGLSIGPFAGGLLTRHLGWRSVFFVSALLGLAAMYTTFRHLKGEEWAEAAGEKLDMVGSALYAGAIVFVMHGLSVLPSMLGGLEIGLGLVLAILFARFELRTKDPVFELRLFVSNRVFAFSSLAALINYSATFALVFLLSLYLQYIKALPPDVAGAVLVAQPVVMALFSPFAGRLSDRVEPQKIASLGMFVTALGLVLFSFISQSTSLGLIIANLALVGFGFAMFSSPNTNAIMSSVEKKHYGIASGTVGAMRLIGQMLSMGMVALVLSVFMGRVEIVPANHHLFLKSMRTAFTISTVLCVIGIFASLARGRIRGRGE